jgi:hypothetical protein
MPKRVAPLVIQRRNIIRIFNANNPNEEPDNLDWDILEKGATFEDNLNGMIEEYSQFNWGRFNDKSEKYEIEEDYEKHKAQERINSALELLDLPPEPDSVDSFSKTKENKPHWKIEQTEGGETYSIQIEIKSHKAVAKDKMYDYGRIQLTVDQALVGLKANITVFKPR